MMWNKTVLDPALRVQWLVVIITLSLTVLQTPEAISAQADRNPELIDIIAAVPSEFPPHYMLDKGGRPIGFAIDVMNQIAEIAGLRVTYQIEDSWPDVYAAMRNKGADIIPNLGITHSRQIQYAFTSPVETSPISIFVRQSSMDIQNEAELAGKTVAVVKGNVAASLFLERNGINTNVYDDIPGALFSLLSGESNALVYPQQVLLKIAQSIGVSERIKVIARPVLEIKRGIAVRKENQQLLLRLNQAVSRFIDTPEYQEIYAQWHGEKPSYWTAARVAWLMSGVILLVLIVMAAWRYFSLHKLHHQLVSNINVRKQAEIALQDSELRFRQIAENINEVFWLGSPDWKQVFYINPVYEKKWGQNAEALYANPQSWMENVHEDDREQVLEDIPKDLNTITDCVEFREYRIYGHNGAILWIRARAFPIRDSNGTVIRIAGIAEDITEHKKSGDQLLHQAHFDTLTKLPNRFIALDRLSQLLTDAQRNAELVAVLFIDLDDFKKINDSLGHETGDKLLIEAAERMKSGIRTGDTVGRLGGDEFIVLLGGLTDVIDAQAVAENLLNRFRDAFSIDGRKLMITASLGIAIFPDDGDSASELLRSADSAMYHSKNIGRNTYSYFTAAMNKNVSRRLSLEEQLHSALERGEFETFYQPKIDINTGKIIGAEALLRWNNPTLGNVSPVEFIPIAEQTGLIVPLGQFVLTEALGMAAQWHQDFELPFHMAVNLSPRQFRDPELVSKIEKTMRQFSVTADRLELEITEGVLMSGHSYINDAISALNNLGVKIAMDDFGTGYSSLSYLRRYPFDIINIDRSFVNDITVDKKDRELVNAAIAMAHGLKLMVLAEGVETEEQLACLKEMGCDYAQGYLLGKPMPGREMTEVLRLEAKSQRSGLMADG